MLIDGLLNGAEYEVYQERFMQRILRKSIGFAACSIARRTLGIAGIAGVADIREIEDVEQRAALEIVNLELPKLLMANHTTLDSIGDASELVRSFYADVSADS